MSASLQLTAPLAYSASSLFVSTFFAINVFVQEGEFYAHSATFGFTSLIPKSFQNTSFEAEEAAKELTNRAAKIKSEEKVKGVAKKAAVSKQARIKEAKTDTKQTNCQKPAEHKQKTEQTTASVPAKENAPVTAYIVRPALR